MTARLRPMRDEEFEPFVERLRAVYADDMIRNGGWESEAAQLKAAEDVARLLPDGLASAVELRIVESDSGEPVGHVMYADREEHGQRSAFLYDIEIYEQHRGRGLGRTAMELLEAEARERGHRRLQLHVFGGNGPARALYRSLGFEEHSVLMGKRLE